MEVMGRWNTWQGWTHSQTAGLLSLQIVNSISKHASHSFPVAMPFLGNCKMEPKSKLAKNAHMSLAYFMPYVFLKESTQNTESK